MRTPIRILLVSAALAAAAGTAFAQGQAQGRHEPRAFSRPTERVEARLAYVKTALKITDSQQAQWSAYADVQRKQAAAREAKMREWRAKMEEHRKQMADNKAGQEHRRPSAVERLDFAEKMHANAIERINAQLAAIKPLYASLSDEQKKVADVVLVPQHRGGRFGGRGHGRGMA
jgi:hypothetical protein